MIKPITTFAVLACVFSAFAQSQTVKIKSKGDDIRTVIDAIFEQTGKQYVLETNFHQSLYMNLEGVSFQKAIDILSSVTDMEFEEKQGIWYIHKKVTISAHTFAPIASKAKAEPESKSGLTKKITITSPTIKSNAPAKTVHKKPTVTKLVDPKTTPAISTTLGQNFALTTPITVPKTQKISLNGRLTVQLKKMDIREVFAEFGRQAKVDIELDDSVPNYKLDASFYNTTLKFALDKVCKVAGLKFTITSSKAVRISKA